MDNSIGLEDSTVQTQHLHVHSTYPASNQKATWRPFLELTWGHHRFLGKAHNHKGTTRVIQENSLHCTLPYAGWNRQPVSLAHQRSCWGMRENGPAPQSPDQGSMLFTFLVWHPVASHASPQLRAPRLPQSLGCEFSPWMTWRLIFTNLPQRATPELSLPYRKLWASGISGLRIATLTKDWQTVITREESWLAQRELKIPHSWEPLTCCLCKPRKCLCCSQRPLPRRKGTFPLSPLGYSGCKTPSSPGRPRAYFMKQIILLPFLAPFIGCIAFQLCHLLAPWPWATTLWLCLLIYKISVPVASTS